MDYKKVRKIIFVCKYNAFRSKTAEDYFNKINKNKKITSVSRGFIMGEVADNVQKSVAKELGVNIKGKASPLVLKEMIKSDLIVVAANDIPKIMFNYWLNPIHKKVVIWKITDEQNRNKKNNEKIVKAIKKKVEKLNKKLAPRAYPETFSKKIFTKGKNENKFS